MRINIPVCITIAIAAGLACTCAMGDETTSSISAASSLQTSTPDSPPNASKTPDKNVLNKEKEEALSPESNDQALDHRGRAVSLTDFKSISENSPGTEIHRAKVMVPVKGGVAAEVTTPLLDNLPGGLGAWSPCESRVQGKIAWNDSGNKEWPAKLVESLCAGAHWTVEPGNCYARLIRGEIDWGGSTKWIPENAVRLCVGTQDANMTITCFEARLRQGQGWQQAISACHQ